MKSFLQAAALTVFTLAASSAGAVSVGSFQADTTGPALSAGEIGFLVLAGEIENFTGFTTFSGLASPFEGLLASSLDPGGSRSFALVNFPSGAPALTGNYVGSAVEGNTVGAVFRNVDSLLLSSTFGPNLFFTFTSDDTLNTSGDVNTGTLTIQNAAIIPLPAGMWLLIGGLGTLGAVRARKRRRQIGA